MTTTKRQNILSALAAFIRQRPGVEYGNYGDPKSYRAEMRSITRDRHDAERLLAAVAWRDSIDADALLAAARCAYSGRLTVEETAKGIAIDYCTGQYFPTEYRRAVCAVLASALWSYWRENMPSQAVASAPGTHQPGIVNAGDYLRKTARKEFGARIQKTWFN